nr:LysR family transcriptional regulator [Seohaeicola saemankumensis]
MRLENLNWRLVSSFLAVAEMGSLSAAARAQGRSQPTLGRDIHTLEQTLGVELFVRRARGLALSETGETLLPMARQMRDAMRAIALTAAGQSQRLDGTVRITASVFASHFVLPPVLAAIREAEPAIQIDLVASDTSENLLFREADIAVRMYRPEQLDIISKKVGELEMGVFAARRYLDRAGRPSTPRELLAHDLVGFDQDPMILNHMKAAGWPATRADFALRCDDQAAYWQLVRAGCGIGFTQANVGHADPLVEEIKLGVTLPRLEVWLAAHEAMRRTPRIRRIWDLLADRLSRVAG